MKVHPTALVDAQASLDDDVEVGPYSVIGPAVRIGAGCRLLARVVLVGRITVGQRNLFHPNVVVGGSPPTLEPTARDGRIDIGDDNVFREACTVYLPAEPGGVTQIGSRNRFYASSSVGNDCVLGDDNVIGVFAGLAGHTTVTNQACIEGSGGTDAHVRIGRGGWLQSHSMARQHVPPFMGVGGHGEVRAINPRFRTPALERAFEIVWKSDLALADALHRLEAETAPEVVELVEFLQRPSLDTTL